jgi:glycosyltransferase involved in cell wall biosynthesis
MHARADVTVVIAALNEAPTIADVVSRCRQYAAEVIVVDGHSRDGTAQLAAAAGATVFDDHRKGKGDAIRVAIPHVTTTVTVFVDADGSHDPDDIPKLVLPIVSGRADHVTGSRLIGGSSELHGGFDEFFRLAGSSFINACLNWKFGVRLSDSQNGFRAVRTAVLRELGLHEDTTTVEQEMIIETLRRGYRMAEVPAHEHRRRFGTSHIRVWRTAPRYLASLTRGMIGAGRPPQPESRTATGEWPLKTSSR